MKRKWDIASEEQQRKCIDEVIARIEELEGATPGVIAAQDIIDIVTENLAPHFYNLGLQDAKKLINEKLNDLETEIELHEVRE